MTDSHTPQPSEPLPQVGWWCWRGDNHGHLAAQPCRSDNVPVHVPAEWADEMRAVIQRIEDGDEGEDPSAAAPPTQAAEERRERYATAISKWHRDPEQPLYTQGADAVIAVADAEQAEARERYMAGLRHADEMNNALMEEVQRYADGTERPVLWSVYNEMHKRALTAEARAAAMERAAALSAAETTNRAALLLWAADELGRMDYDTDSNDYGYDTYRDAWNGGVMDGAEKLRRLAAEEQPAEAQDSLPAWLYRRFMPDGAGWENLDADDRSYWEHQARAVRRAVARGGFKAGAEQPAVGEQPAKTPWGVCPDCRAAAGPDCDCPPFADSAP
ncbi:hypothetical protein OG713_34675 [Streptomyces sp. NBC_00723]|uniref:hypothetical protein n=1 Tax=Streptomyces sp. NBC_00723 TaxID=2903673 RepID=UPI00386B38A1